MSQKISQKNRKFGLKASLFVISLSLVLGGCVNSRPVYAENNQVSATVCDDGPPALTITEPINKSTSTTGQIQISGVALRTTQIDISVNGVPSQSVAIGANPRFSIGMGLSEGANILLLDAYFSCNQRHTTKTIEVAVSSEQGYTKNSKTNLRESKNNNSQNKSTTKTPQDRIRRNLGLAPKDGYETQFIQPILSWFFVLALILSIVILVYPVLLDSFFIRFSSGLTGAMQLKRARRRHVFIRLVAFLIAVILGIILQV